MIGFGDTLCWEQASSEQNHLQNFNLFSRMRVVYSIMLLARSCFYVLVTLMLSGRKMTRWGCCSG